MYPQVARRLVEQHDLETIATQYDWHVFKIRNKAGNFGGLLASAIEHDQRPPKGHPDERWYREAHPYQYLGESNGRVYNAPKARGGGHKSRRTANKGSKAGAAIIPGGLKYGQKHGQLSHEKRTHRHKIGLKNEDDDQKGMK